MENRWFWHWWNWMKSSAQIHSVKANTRSDTGRKLHFGIFISIFFFSIAWSTCCHVSLQDSCGPVPQTFSQKCNLSITSPVTHISPIGRKREKGECISSNEFPKVFDSRQKKKNCFRFQPETSRIHQDGGKICSDGATRGKLVRCDQPVRSLLEGGGLVTPLGSPGKCCFSISF